MKNPLVATGIPDSIEKVQPAPDCAFVAGRASVALHPVENELDNLKSLVVMEFNEDEVPIFTQGYHPHELTEVVTADRCTAFVKIIVDLRAQLAAAQPVPEVNAMLVEALEAAEKLEHAALVALSEATYELKVGNTYTTATDTYKANNDLIHRLDKILNSQYRDRKRTALTAAKQAQPEPFTPDWSQDSAAAESIREHQAICNLLLKEMRYIAGISTGQVKRVAEQALEAVKQAQPERAPLSEKQCKALWHGTYEAHRLGGYQFAANAIRALIKEKQNETT